MTDIDTTINYYKDLLLFQYVDKAKARATIGVLAEAALCDLLPIEISKAFDVETAVGPQLDTLGKYIGFSRRILGPLIRNWFEVVDYVTYNPLTTYPGFTDYIDNTINSDTQFYRYLYANNSASDLTDDEYRYMLKLKMALNNCNNTLSEIQIILFDFFSYDIICYDLKNMTISYVVLSSKSYFAGLAISQDLLPRPMGVGIAGVFEVVDNTKLFGFQDYIFNAGNEIGFSDYLTGFTGYQWIDYLNKIA